MNHAPAQFSPVKNDILAVIEANSKLATSTRARYKKVLRGYLTTGGSLTDAEALASYAQGLSNSGRSFLKAAIKLWGEDVAYPSLPILWDSGRFYF